MSKPQPKNPNRSVKDQVRTMLDQLPDECTIEDVQYSLFVLEKIRQGREEIARGEGVPHEEVERKVKRWFPA